MSEPLEEKTSPMKQSAAFAGSTLVTMGLVDLVAHLGPTGFLVGGLASYVAWKHGPEIYEYVREKLPSPASPEPTDPGEQPPRKRGRSLMDRALGRFPDPVEEDEQTREKGEDVQEEEASPMEWAKRRREWQAEQDEEVTFACDGEDDLLLASASRRSFLFSSVLEHFHPTLERIFLARTSSGRDLYCSARDLCHVALAGNTGGGKSSIMRLLMLQLCQGGVRVLLLNPHYTRYDIENDEDWTPFEPYLVYPPMECRTYEVIEHYLKSTAKDLIPKRLERRAHSQPVGKPYFIVIDELPSIVREIDAAPDSLRVILEEGRKVGVFLISAAHDFLVKTIAPKAGGGSIRECYRTAYYVGGDPTTARTLLDMPASLIPEDELGQGVVMLRGVPARKATQVFVPYVDNASLYRLLGPSTYRASRNVSVPEEDFPRLCAISTHGNTASAGNEAGNAVEMAPHAGADKVIDGVFPISKEPVEMGKTSVKPDVSDEKLEMIRRMKEKKFQDHEIAALVGLAGRKYSLYRQ